MEMREELIELREELIQIYLHPSIHCDCHWADRDDTRAASASVCEGFL